MSDRTLAIIGVVATILGLIVSLYIPIRNHIRDKRRKELRKRAEEEYERQIIEYHYKERQSHPEKNDSEETRTFEIQPQFIDGKLVFYISNLTNDPVSIADITLQTMPYSSANCFVHYDDHPARMRKTKLKKGEKMNVKFDEKEYKDSYIHLDITWKDSKGNLNFATTKIYGNKAIKI